MPKQKLDAPSLQVVQHGPDHAAPRVVLHGAWNLRGIGHDLKRLRRALRQAAGHPRHWDLRQVDKLDTAGAMLLWQAWGQQLPADLELLPIHTTLLQRISQDSGATAPDKPGPSQPKFRLSPLHLLGNLLKILNDSVSLLGYFVLDLLYLTRHPQLIPWREISATIFKSGPQALLIVGLVGFLLGVVVAYQSALTLAIYGANIFLVDLLGISILRELGPLIAAIIIAGRSGSAFTAQLGVMRVTQEIDALETFGVSPSLRLILPKIIALAITLPLLVLWADIAGLVGGLLVGKYQLGIGFPTFLERLPQVVPMVNYWIGIGKGMVFGILIALVSGFYGMRIRPNTESLSTETTHSVVTSITLVILVDALFALMLANVGFS